MPTSVEFDPAAELATLREFARQFVSEGWLGPRDVLPAALSAFSVPVDILDTGPALVVRASLPGLHPNDVRLAIIGETLTLSGKARDEEDEPGVTYLRRERRPLAFHRTLPLPVPVDAEQAEAIFKDGVLTLTLPKNEAVRPRTIKIVSG